MSQVICTCGGDILLRYENGKKSLVCDKCKTSMKLSDCDMEIVKKFSHILVEFKGRIR